MKQSREIKESYIEAKKDSGRTFTKIFQRELSLVCEGVKSNELKVKQCCPLGQKGLKSYFSPVRHHPWCIPLRSPIPTQITSSPTPEKSPSDAMAVIRSMSPRVLRKSACRLFWPWHPWETCSYQDRRELPCPSHLHPIAVSRVQLSSPTLAS